MSEHLTIEGAKEIAMAYWNMIHPPDNEDLEKKLESRIKELEGDNE